jgi:hypothetical protein
MSNSRDMAAGPGTILGSVEVENNPAAPEQLEQPAQRDCERIDQNELLSGVM